ncbi:MAG TPA: hypothetical protein VNR87_14735 [Flavisolibacter sp.]|nr:hypothetical protein [Flavisolibacter sp.]
MKITKGEYCQFSLGGRLDLLKEFGELLGEVVLDQLFVQVYRIHDFYVEVRFDHPTGKLLYAEPLKNLLMLLYALRSDPV